MFRKLAPLLIALAIVPSARSQDMSGLFTREGIEVRADQRVFALFAMLNSLGYDREDRRGPLPLEAPQYTDVRQALRLQLAVKHKELETAAAQAYLGAHREPMALYVERALQLKGAPDFAAPEGSDAELVELGKALKAFYSSAGNDLFESQRGALREHAKAWVDAIDAATAKGREFTRVPDEMPAEEDAFGEEEPPRVVVVVNPLDSHSAAYKIKQRKIHYLVLGSAQGSADGAADPVLVAALTEMLRPHLQPALKKMGRAGVKKALGSRGVKLGKGESPYDAALDALAQSFARAALKRPLVWPSDLQRAERATLERAADGAVAWYAKQKQPLPELATTLVARTLGTKAP